MEQLKLTQEWDKVFPKSDKVEHSKATFHNRYGITLAADVYVPKNAEGKLPAIAVSGPFGAVKEQSSGLYAQKMAERAFSQLPLTRPIPARAVVRPDMLLRPTSIPRISAQRWIFCLCRITLTRRVSASSASAAGAVWRSTPRPSTRASRRPPP